MQQQGTSTPTGVTAADPAPAHPEQQQIDPARPEPAVEQEQAGQRSDTTSRDLKGVQSDASPYHPSTPGRPEGIVSNPDPGAPK